MPSQHTASPDITPYYYQTIEVPGLGLCLGDWDHREHLDQYLGEVDMRGKRVLEIGPANGFFTFAMERRGASVLALDLGESGEWDAVPNRAAPVGHESLRRRLQNSVQRVERAFWDTHQRLNSSARLVYGSVYDAQRVVREKIDIAFMGNVLQHLRDPVLAIQQTAGLAKEKIIITESIWHDDVAFLEGRSMMFLPKQGHNIDHSWWLVPPALVMDLIELLGFADIKCTYHNQKFNGSASDPLPRTVRHYTVTGTRTTSHPDYGQEAWHPKEREGSEILYWSRTSDPSVSIFMEEKHAIEGDLAFKLGSSSIATVSISLNGTELSKLDCSWPPIPIRIPGIILQPGDNTLQLRSSQPPKSSPSDPRALGLAVYPNAGRLFRRKRKALVAPM